MQQCTNTVTLLAFSAYTIRQVSVIPVSKYSRRHARGKMAGRETVDEKDKEREEELVRDRRMNSSKL